MMLVDKVIFEGKSLGQVVEHMEGLCVCVSGGGEHSRPLEGLQGGEKRRDGLYPG